ncbi:MAG: Dickkopf N-terminal cysteine-rich domain-containing protein [Halobacteriota archaeon]
MSYCARDAFCCPHNSCVFLTAVP